MNIVFGTHIEKIFQRSAFSREEKRVRVTKGASLENIENIEKSLRLLHLLTCCFTPLQLVINKRFCFNEEKFTLLFYSPRT